MSTPRMIAVLAAVALVVGGCSAAPSDGDIDGYGPDGGLGLAVVQGRDDRGARIVAIEITNNRADAVTLTRAQLTGPQLVGAAVWERGTTLRPGLTVDLRVQLGEAACPLAADLTPTVTVDFSTAEGQARSVSGEPEQPSGVLTRIAKEDCLIAGVLSHAEISVRAVEYTPGSGVPAVLVLGIEPTSEPGSLTIRAVTATVLLGLVDPAGSLSQGYEINRTIEAGADDGDLRISLVPNRCDTHAVAEDKRGTFIPLDVALDDGLTGTYYVAMPDDEKGQLYAFVTDYCAR